MAISGVTKRVGGLKGQMKVLSLRAPENAPEVSFLDVTRGFNRLEELDEEYRTELMAIVKVWNARARRPLLALLNGASEKHAAALVGMTTSGTKHWRDRDPEYDRDYELCKDIGFALNYESELEERAMDRDDRSSASLLQFLMKSRSPDYREKQQVHVSGVVLAGQARQKAVTGWEMTELERDSGITDVVEAEDVKVLDEPARE